MSKKMNHSEYPKSLEGKSYDELMYIARDAREAIKANPTGENVGYYADEINYVCNELHRQRKGELR